MAADLRQHVAIAREGIGKKIAVVALKLDFAQAAPVAAIVSHYIVPFVVGVVGILTAPAEHQAARAGQISKLAKLVAQLFVLAGILAEELGEVHALAVGTALPFGRLELGARLNQLAQFIGREGTATFALRLATGFHLDRLIGLTAVAATVVVFAAGNVAHVSLAGAAYQVIAHLGGTVAERIAVGSFTRGAHQGLQPVVHRSDLMGTVEDRR